MYIDIMLLYPYTRSLLRSYMVNVEYGEMDISSYTRAHMRISSTAKTLDVVRTQVVTHAWCAQSPYVTTYTRITICYL